VNTSNIVRGGDRVGIYYCEKGASQRPSKVIYDRAASSIATAKAEDFDWDKIFDGADWFHFTGITPALSPEVAKICEIACKKAKEKGITISSDLNFRKKLWTREQANKTMTTLCKYIDVCIANEEDAKDVFGIEAENTDIDSGKLNSQGYISVAKQLTDKFNFKYVAITLRESISANDNNWSAMLYNGKDGKAYFSKKYAMHIVDRVGGGDSFGGGLIYALRSGYDEQKAIEFAVAASCLKHSVEGDYNMVSVAEVNALAGGSGSGRVQR
jgi:2-dehydro-3-deoxygluconokinase